MKLLKSSIILGLLAFTMACDKPDLPDPTIEYPTPPAILMQPPERMKPLDDS